jgi:hypothetical protein
MRGCEVWNRSTPIDTEELGCDAAYRNKAVTLATDIENSVGMGIDGLECFSPNYSEEMTQTARRCAENTAF